MKSLQYFLLICSHVLSILNQFPRFTLLPQIPQNSFNLTLRQPLSFNDMSLDVKCSDEGFQILFLHPCQQFWGLTFDWRNVSRKIENVYANKVWTIPSMFPCQVKKYSPSTKKMKNKIERNSFLFRIENQKHLKNDVKASFTAQSIATDSVLSGKKIVCCFLLIFFWGRVSIDFILQKIFLWVIFSKLFLLM